MRHVRRIAGIGAGGALGVAALILALHGPAGEAGAQMHDGGHNRVHEVSIRDFAFRPATVEIHAGDVVEWVNLDLAPHTATASGDGWASGDLGQGAAAKIRFPAAGEYEYFCAHHPGMTGRVVVTPAGRDRGTSGLSGAAQAISPQSQLPSVATDGGGSRGRK